MLKILCATAALSVAVPALGHAADCGALKGKVIFEDTFADDTGGWLVDPDASFGKPALTIKLHDPITSYVFPNNTFNATEGDYCLEAVLPSPPAADNLAYVGLIVLFADPNDYLLLMVSSNDEITLWRKSGGKWTQVANLSDPSLKPQPGSVVTLRLTVQGTLVTPSVNGASLHKVRVQVPEGNLQFAIYAQTDKPVPNPGASFQFNRFRVTTGQ